MAGMDDRLLNVSSAAFDKIDSVRRSNDFADACLRVTIRGRQGARFAYEISLEDPRDRREDDQVVELPNLTIHVDPSSAQQLAGAIVDVDPSVPGGALKVLNPNEGWADPLAQRVQEVLDTQVNPGVASHGGVVNLLEVKDKIAYIQLGGGCQGCAQVDVTLKQGIEVAIQRQVPEIVAVRDTTDHAAGTNPYFESSKK
jgi:Fe/S biogenesis protein NfuA